MSDICYHSYSLAMRERLFVAFLRLTMQIAAEVCEGIKTMRSQYKFLSLAVPNAPPLGKKQDALAP
jgi:hypothetical protein